MNIYKKAFKDGIRGFACGILLYVLMLFVMGRFTFFSGADEIPLYLIRRIPYGMIKCVLFGCAGYLIGVSYHIIKEIYI